ncbi:hypothetical protein B484DRAFT_389094, partial [Ochromonadaceae sp. CCMP2298]
MAKSPTKTGAGTVVGGGSGGYKFLTTAPATASASAPTSASASVTAPVYATPSSGSGFSILPRSRRAIEAEKMALEQGESDVRCANMRNTIAQLAAALDSLGGRLNEKLEEKDLCVSEMRASKEQAEAKALTQESQGLQMQQVQQQMQQQLQQAQQQLSYVQQEARQERQQLYTEYQAMQAQVAQVQAQTQQAQAQMETQGATEAQLRSQISSLETDLTLQNEQTGVQKTSVVAVQGENRSLSLTLSENERLIESMATDQANTQYDMTALREVNGKLESAKEELG